MSTTPTLPSETPPTPATSSLGGASAIQNRFNEFMANDGKTPPEIKKEEAPEKKEAVKEVKEEKTETQSLLPPEKTPEVKKEEKTPQSTEKKVGSDGLTKEERAELVKFKEKASRVDELEAKLGEFDLTRKERDELRTLKTEMEEKLKTYEAKATAFDVRNSPHFQKTIEEPGARLTTAMESICATHKLTPEDVFKAIYAEDPMKGNAVLSEYMSSLDAMTARTFERIVGDLRELNIKANQLIEKAPEAWTAIQAEQKKREEADKLKAKESYKLASGAIHGAMKERFPFLADEKLSKDVLDSSMEIDFDALSPDKKAYYAQAGQTLLHVNNIIREKDAEIARLKAAVAKQSREPGLADGDVPKKETATQVEEQNLEKMTVGQRMAAFAAGKLGS